MPPLRPRTLPAVICAVAIGAACGSAPAREDARPCIGWAPRALHPLLLGDVTQLRAGRGRGSDCDDAHPVPIEAVTWRTADSGVVHVTPRGVVRGIRPGMFRLRASAGGEELHAIGFVLPRGWQVRMQPESAEVRAGDTVRVRVRAVTGGGEPLPAVPSTVATPEYLAWAAEVVPNTRAGRHTPMPEERGLSFDRAFFQSTDVDQAAAFVARRAGETMLVGLIGARADTMRVIVRPGRPPR